MTKAYLTPPKGIKVANGGKMRHGQIIGGTDTMTPCQRSLNSSSPLHPRNGAAKVTAVAQPVPGQKRQTPDAVFTGPGQSALDDEPNLPMKHHQVMAPIHPGMTDKQRAKIDPVANDPSVILNDAAALGRKA
jgi:hypothetical protein